MAVAGDLMRKMLKFLPKFIVILILYQCFFISDGHAGSLLTTTPTPKPTRGPTSTTTPGTKDVSPTSGSATKSVSTGVASTAAPVSTTTNDETTQKKESTAGSEGTQPTPTATSGNPTSTSKGTTDGGSSSNGTSTTTISGTSTTTLSPSQSTGTSQPPASETSTSASTTVSTSASATVTGTTTAKPSSSTSSTTTARPEPYFDDKDYYTYTAVSNETTFQEYWIDIEKDARFNKMFKPDDYKSVNRSYAVPTHLPWAVPYYGHIVKDVTVAAGGFIHMNNFTPWARRQLTKSQNIAPLMADLTRSSEDSKISGIYMVYNDSMIVFEWRAMKEYHLQNYTGKDVNDTFTFQVHILKNGDIRFLYANHPTPVSDMSTLYHTVKAGISDGFYTNKVLREYHVIDVSKHTGDGVVITFYPKPTCIQAKTCEKCINVGVFKCKWCPALNHCTDGMDRRREDWLNSPCKNAGKVNCSALPVVPSVTPSSTMPPTSPSGAGSTTAGTTPSTKRPKPKPSKAPCIDDGKGKCKKPAGTSPPSKAGANAGAIVAVFLLVFIVFGFGGWFWYAYKNPTTSSGMFLITAKTSCCKKGRITRSSKDYQAFMESDTESLPL